ncbi:hypothetical protein RclHR1_00490028 [Rhizophagus clarus]|uniref:Phosphatidylglycerol/phosphatidylinositol transfer protein n=1 Tax=Rhizophagus clarus TaxID=94130 RepID=A0A2Z6S2J3_9GLOM|nr:hypothetical protein RclHR1_00490028 [Rhizophagus clarus]GES80620.1 hypothetical protein GLOIN_2v1503725 [Rhizophagus clarus]
MRNHKLKCFFITLIILVVNSFNTNATTIVTRQTGEIKCQCSFDYIHKSNTFTDNVPKNSINTHLNIACNTKDVSTEVSEYALWKVVDGKYVNMQGFGLRQLGPGRYSLHADPSECYNAPKEGMVGVAMAYFTVYSNNPGIVITKEWEEPCYVENVVINCPPPV